MEEERRSSNNDDKQRPWSDLLRDLVFPIVKKIPFLDRWNAKFAFPGWVSTINATPYGPFLLSNYAAPLRWAFLMQLIKLDMFSRSIKHGWFMWLLLCDIFQKLFFFYTPFSQVVIELSSNEESFWEILLLNTTNIFPMHSGADSEFSSGEGQTKYRIRFK